MYLHSENNRIEARLGQPRTKVRLARGIKAAPGFRCEGPEHPCPHDDYVHVTSAWEWPGHPCPRDEYVHVASLLPGCDRWGWSKDTFRCACHDFLHSLDPVL